MKRKTLIIFIITIITFVPCIAYSYDGDDENLSLDNLIEQQIDNLKIEELERLVKDISRTTDDILPEIDFKEFMVSLIKGEKVLEGKDLVNGIFKLVFREVIANSSLLVKLLVLSIICSVLMNLQSAFEKDTVGELAFYVCYLVLTSIAIKSFIMAMDIAKSAINDMVILMQVLLPTLLTLLLAVGGITSSALFRPIILGAVSVVSTLMRDIILPMIFFGAIVGIVSKISSRIQISRLSGLIRQISTGIIGVVLTIFIGIISIQGVTSSKVDGVTIRTAKFAVDKFVPIVGKFLSDAMETVVGCSMILKNAVGVIGMIALFLICIIPVMKIISLIIVYKLTSAVIEPIANNRIVDCLGEISKSLIMLLATVSAVGVMFFIAVTIIIGAGNITVMLR
ncbi:stage III sporulation protein AE [Brassicibacter mesophilus]|uniref:stage III sporulation protein AE n=1 Tax=Brassicibacter mesophilus TaxID=745119 RepID=UPI003D2505C6